MYLFIEIRKCDLRILGLLGLRPWHVIYGYWFEWIRGGRIFERSSDMCLIWFFFTIDCNVARNSKSYIKPKHTKHHFDAQSKINIRTCFVTRVLLFKLICWLSISVKNPKPLMVGTTLTRSFYFTIVIVNNIRK